MYQVFSSLQGHLQFFLHFFFTFMEHFFIDHPILVAINSKIISGRGLTADRRNSRDGTNRKEIHGGKNDAAY